MRKSRKVDERKLVIRFMKLGLGSNMVLSNCELFGNFLIGFDLKMQKLVIAEENEDLDSRHTIELADLKTISIKKIYKNIRAGELNFRKLSDFISSIHLLFEFRNGREPIEVPIFAERKSIRGYLKEMEKKLSKWYSLVSGMINKDSYKVGKSNCIS